MKNEKGTYEAECGQIKRSAGTGQIQMDPQGMTGPVTAYMHACAYGRETNMGFLFKRHTQWHATVEIFFG